VLVPLLLAFDYFGLAWGLNSTDVTITASEIQTKSVPMPNFWPRTMRTSNIFRVVVRRAVQSNSGFQVRLINLHGQEEAIVSELKEYQAEYIAQLTEATLISDARRLP
jgi:hypothetical protein